MPAATVFLYLHFEPRTENRNLPLLHPMGAKRKKSKAGKSFRMLILIVLLISAGAAYVLFKPNTGAFYQGHYLYVRTGSTYEEVKEELQSMGFVSDIRSFDLLARRAGYTDRVQAGKYEIRKGMSNYQIVRMLRSGRQTPVKLVINKLRTRQDFINLIARNLEADTNILKHIMADTVFLSQYGLDTNTVMCAVMPDTYEFYWNTSPEKVFRKIAANYARFWTDARKAQAKAQGLSPQQSIVLASIVEEESNMNDERPLIASVYLNRLRKGIKLQADPTARFAYGDFLIKRITGVQTGIPSAYNTYYVSGLPPGPICTPSPGSIEAVLKAPRNNYLYFCAKENFSGYHNFASTLQEHYHNAKRYHDALNRRGILQ